MPALAQEDLPDTPIVSTVKATPRKAGTSKDPQGLSIAAAARLIVEPGFDPPIVTGIDILVGKGLVWNGERYVKCSKRALDRQGPKGCPRKSMMGSATATDMRGGDPTSTVKMVFLNGGAARRYLCQGVHRQHVLPAGRVEVPGDGPLPLRPGPDRRRGQRGRHRVQEVAV